MTIARTRCESASRSIARRPARSSTTTSAGRPRAMRARRSTAASPAAAASRRSARALWLRSPDKISHLLGEHNMSGGLIFALACALLAIVYGAWQITRILKLPEGNERMREIAGAVREGAIAYLWRQYKTIALVGVVLFFLIGFFLDWASAFGFLIGALLSGACGIICM